MDSLSAEWQPVIHTKVDGLPQVEATRETGMVGTRHGDDELTGILHTSKHGYFVGSQQRRGDHGHQLHHQIGLRFKQLPHCISPHSLKRIRFLAWHAIPHLRAPTVMVVDRIQIIVLRVPAKRGKEHADVEPGDCDAVDEFGNISQQRTRQKRQHVQIPALATTVYGAALTKHRRRSWGVDWGRGRRKRGDEFRSSRGQR